MEPVSRLVWFAVGVTSGVYGVLRARRAAQALTPTGLAARATALGAGLRVLADEASVGMRDRERQLRRDLLNAPRAGAGRLLDPPGRRSADGDR